MTFWQRLRTPPMPPAAPLPRRLDLLLGAALAIFGFFLPFSVAGVAILMGVLLALALAAGPAVWRSAPWRDPVVAVGLVLFAYIAVHTVWTTGMTAQSLQTINRYQELLLAAVLLALFRLVSRKQLFLWGLMGGSMLYALAHWVGLAWQPAADYLELRHISAGFVLSVCAFILLEQAGGSRRPWVLRVLAAFFALTVLYAIDGRTGHLVLLLLAAWAAWLQSPRRWRWAASVAVPLVVLAVALGSTAVQKRLGETMAGSLPAENGDLSSTGIRIELLRNGVNLAGKHYLAGSGFAEYFDLSGQSAQELYENDPVRRSYLERHWVQTPNPHNEYIMQLVGGGLPALGLFLAWLALPMLRQGGSRRIRASLAGISLAFAAGCLFNSMLMDFVEGHFHVALLAWLLAQCAEAPAQPSAGAA